MINISCLTGKTYYRRYIVSDIFNGDTMIKMRLLKAKKGEDIAFEIFLKSGMLYCSHRLLFIRISRLMESLFVLK